MVAILSVSGGLLDAKCKTVIDAMKQLNLCGDVTPNYSVYDKMVEHGCRVVVVGRNEDSDVRRLWYHLRNANKLSCAHVEIKTHTSGCVYDVFSHSRCPSKV